MEEFYGLMAAQRWAEVLELAKAKQPTLKKNKSEWAHISTILEVEFIKYAVIEKPILISRLCCEYVKLNIAGYIILSDEGLEKIETLGIETLLEESESAALSFAKICQFSATAKTLVNNAAIPDSKFNSSNMYEQVSPVNSQPKNRFARTDWLTPLFKSENEALFYQALVGVFPSYFIYPNVAISNIFELELIKPSLTKEEITYYFKAIVDFVVYDPVDNHNPKYFFELDSSYHDKHKAMHNDNLKNNIFAAANIPLHRTRRKTDSLTTVIDFKSTIIEMTR